MPVSVVRAGIMLILNSLLRLAVGMNDPPTSLSVAVTVICIFDPTAVVDISLWLSALATLGVLTVSEHRNSTPIKNEKKRGNIFVFALKGASLSLLTSALAVTSTILLCITCFRGFSLISPASTLVISPLIELIMYIGSLTLILGDILPIGKLLKPITHFTLWLIELISSADGIFVSTSYIIIRIFALILTVAFALVLILKLKKVKLWLTALALGLCLFMTTGYILNRTNLADDSIVFADIDDSSCTLIKSQGAASLIYSDTYSRTRIYKPVRLLSEENICELDAVAFTHYSFGVPKALSDLAGSYKLKRVVLPKARCREERAILAMIKTRCSEFGITLEHFESREAMHFGSVGMTLNHSTVYGEDTIRAAYTLTEGESKTVYLSSGMLLEDYYKFSVKLCDGADTVILGTHGKSYKENVYMDRIFKSAKSILLCSDGLFLTQDAMAEYTKYGCKIYSHPYKINIKD